ncbi:MAG: transcription antitermination factor NusB [Lamprobacter sp.]|uniref:transcription antitermination factor NusB n=1 Tax=Lamprobacter sp. TaxID=3100796 RepID=UPI002B256E11|nr:transcription antitermination factor NusB [Lamprobacter sp.]MEA3639004.1 transcription antitermination factor NusB [Lamprobacter sp.]
MAGRRSEARRYAVLALYQWQVSGQSPAEIASHFFDDPSWMEAIAEGMAEARAEAQAAASSGQAGKASQQALKPRPYDHQLFSNLLREIPEQADEIDDALRGNLDRSLQSLDPVERSILRIGTYELLFSVELPVRVVINEAVELAKAFGAEQGHRYVNAVLDRVARSARADEFARKTTA